MIPHMWGFMENASGADPWMKRVRWANTGDGREDQRIDTLLSLWLEGELSQKELEREYYHASNNEGFAPVANYRHASLREAACYLRKDQYWVALRDAASLNEFVGDLGKHSRRCVFDAYCAAPGIGKKDWLYKAASSSERSGTLGVLNDAFSSWLAGVDIDIQRELRRQYENIANKSRNYKDQLTASQHIDASLDDSKAFIRMAAIGTMITFAEDHTVLPVQREQLFADLLQHLKFESKSHGRIR